MGLRASEAPITVALPTLDSILEGATSESKNAEGTTGTEPQVKQEEGLDRIEREQKHRREIYKQQQRIKELEEKIGDTSNKTSGIDPNSKNPFRDAAKAKNMSQDEIVRLALEAMDDDLTPTEKKNEFANMTPQEIADLVKKQLKEEQGKEVEEKSKIEAETKAITDFKAKISSKATELADKYPLVESLGGIDSAYKVIEDQFLADSKEFGQEYATENMMKIDDAVKKVNESLATSVKQALKYKHLRKFLMDAIKEEGIAKEGQSDEDDQLEEKEVTVTNKSFSAATEAAHKPKFGSDKEELDFLINKFI